MPEHIEIPWPRAELSKETKRKVIKNAILRASCEIQCPKITRGDIGLTVFFVIAGTFIAIGFFGGWTP